jgi:hypothetical protein
VLIIAGIMRIFDAIWAWSYNGVLPDEFQEALQQLVVGIDAQRVVEAALFAWSGEEKGFVELARYAGAAV